MLSQIPPQKIYAGASCSAVLPDYRLKITASDNCEIISFTQVPAPGFVLNSAAKTTTVTVKATDAAGNFKQVVFTVSLLDTIRPILTIDQSLLADNLEQAKELYNFADKIIERNLAIMDKNIADTIMFPETEFPNLRNVYEDSTYYKKTMLTWTSPGYAITGVGSRVITFYNADRDTIVIKH